MTVTLRLGSPIADPGDLFATEISLAGRWNSGAHTAGRGVALRDRDGRQIGARARPDPAGRIDHAAMAGPARRGRRLRGRARRRRVEVPSADQSSACLRPRDGPGAIFPSLRPFTYEIDVLDLVHLQTERAPGGHALFGPAGADGADEELLGVDGSIGLERHDEVRRDGRAQHILPVTARAVQVELLPASYTSWSRCRAAAGGTRLGAARRRGQADSPCRLGRARGPEAGALPASAPLAWAPLAWRRAAGRSGRHRYPVLPAESLVVLRVRLHGWSPGQGAGPVWARCAARVAVSAGAET